MKLGGYRHDGTLRVLIPGGMTVLLRGDIASPPLDEQEADAYGPWIEPDTSLSWQERQELGKRLDRARTVPARTFALTAPSGQPAIWRGSDETVAPKSPPPVGEADAEAEAPAGPTKSKPLTKGELLASINEIAKAKEKDKDAAGKPPRSTMKRLKLEFESEDREGDEKKPVSEEAKATQSGETPGPPVSVTVPDHLQPMEKRT